MLDRARCAPKRRAGSGFTLIELMTVIAIIGILVAIALPSYQDSVRKGRRGQAKADVVEIAQRAERWRTVNNTFTGFALEDGVDDRSPREGESIHYEIAFDIENGGQGYTLTATPEGGQASDTRCGTLTLDETGAKDRSGTAEDIAQCW